MSIFCTDHCISDHAGTVIIDEQLFKLEKDTVHVSWMEAIFMKEMQKPYFKQIKQHLCKEKNTKNIVFPPEDLIYSWTRLCPIDNVKVVILGQDPYHDHGQAMGLAFSVPDGVTRPPSLRNIFTEILADSNDSEIMKTGKHMTTGDLSRWARQGVLLLNTALTVRAHQANSHQYIGWEHLTDAVIRYLGLTDKPIVFMLWGSHARKKAGLIKKSDKKMILQAAHPSPLSAYKGFFGCKHFSQCNAFLVENGLEPIDWS